VSLSGAAACFFQFFCFPGSRSTNTPPHPLSYSCDIYSYYEIKHGAKPKKNVWIENETKDIKQKILDSKYSKKIKQNTLKIYEEVGTEVFGNSRVVEILGCSEVTATAYLKRMEKELKITVSVEGMGKGKYKFSV